MRQPEPVPAQQRRLRQHQDVANEDLCFADRRFVGLGVEQALRVARERQDIDQDVGAGEEVPKAVGAMEGLDARERLDERGEAARITGRPDRSARVILGKLMDSGLLRSETPKGAVRLRFGVESAAELFPRLFVAG